MKKKISAFLALLLAASMCLSLWGCQKDKVTPEETQAAFEQFTQSCFQDTVTGNLLDLHYTLKSPEDYGISQYDCTFGQFSLDALKDSLKENQELKKKLESFSYENLTESQKHTYDILSWLFEKETPEELLLYEEPLGLVNGIHNNFPVILSEYTFYDKQDVEDYLELLPTIQDYFTQVIEFEQEKSEAGLFMADPVADQVLSACRALCENPEESYLISSFDERIDLLGELTDMEKAAYKEQNRQLVLNDFLPAYEILIDGIEALKGTGVTDLGICDLPKGKEYARLLLSSFTGTDRTPEEYEELLMDYVNDGLSRMAELMRQHPELIEQAGQFQFSLTDPEQILADLQIKIKEDFPSLPVDAVYNIKYVPKVMEESLAPAFYMVPPIDAYEDNVIYINNSQLSSDSLYSTLAHEGYPGHLYQTVYSHNSVQDPLRSVLNFSGFSEGWASYVEMQSYYWDSSLSEPLAELVSLNNEVSLCLYSLMDLYISYFGYDLEDTSAFLENYFGISDEAITEEIYYYIIGDPLNYLKYGGGYVEFCELRKAAQEALGSKFSAIEFHKFILESGDAPFPVLEKWMNAWIEAQ